MAKMRMRQAIALALSEELERDPKVLLLGEDVGAAEGVFKTSEGLLDRFGPTRVRDTPISEMGFLGVAVGAASMGYRPVVEIMFGEFLGVALDQLVTEAAKFRYLSRGQYPAPLVVRTSIGPGLGFAAQHSATLESWFVNTPGLVVVELSGANSAYHLTKAAVRSEDPVLVLEPRILYGEREEVETDKPLALGDAQVRRQGTDLTLVALGQTVRTALEAAEATSLDIEVIDLATVYPWDTETVRQSVTKTGRLMTVEANPLSGGWGAHVASWVASETFSSLVAAPRRVACPDAPVPYSAALERAYVPQVSDVTAAIDELVQGGVRV